MFSSTLCYKATETSVLMCSYNDNCNIFHEVNTSTCLKSINRLNIPHQPSTLWVLKLEDSELP